MVGLAALVFSRAFIAYSTSGLENAATHLLVVLTVLGWTRETRDTATSLRQLTHLSVLRGLLLLNRMDSIVLVSASHLKVGRPAAYSAASQDWIRTRWVAG